MTIIKKNLTIELILITHKFKLCKRSKICLKSKFNDEITHAERILFRSNILL